MSVVISVSVASGAAVAVSLIAAMTGSASGGQAIAVDGGLSSSHPVTKQEFGRTAV